MYDILQLNDMLVPELVDIADQLKINNPGKLEKQDLIYKILDKQAVLESAVKGGDSAGKPRRRRIIKTTTGNSTEEAEVMNDEVEASTAKNQRNGPCAIGAARRRKGQPIKGKFAGPKSQTTATAANTTTLAGPATLASPATAAGTKAAASALQRQA